MRWFFVGVVALNIAYLAWYLQAGRDTAGGHPVVAVNEVDGFPQTLQLLDERGSAAYPRVPATLPSAVVPSGCPAVGPLGEDDAGRVVATLGQAGFPARVREVPAPDALVYWVYLAPAATRETAVRQLRELHARGIDSFVVADGPYRRAISLGSFQSKDSALGVQGRLRAAGYPAELQEQRRDLRQTWVILDEPAAQGFAEHLPPLDGAVRFERLPCGVR